MQNNRVSRSIDNMDIGFYKTSLAKNAPDVGAVIYIPCPIEMYPEFWNPLDRPQHKRAMINGKDVPVWRVGECLVEKITQPEYDFLIADRTWAKEYDPDSPEAQPYRAVVTTPKAKAEVSARPEINIREIPLSNFMP